MKKEIELIRHVRNSILKMIEPLSDGQLNFIPEKFDNNIIWNLAHMIICQQGMCYKQGNLDIHVDSSDFADFVSGTRPDRVVNHEEISMIRDLFLTTIDRFEQDVDTDKFAGYKAWHLPNGIELNTIGDALKLTAVHEGRHFGAVTALSKLVS